MIRTVWHVFLGGLWTVGLVSLLAALYVLAHGMPAA